MEVLPTVSYKTLQTGIILAIVITTYIVCRWMSEKYDGIRIQWNGKCFYSRNSKPVYVPKHITDTLPNIPLDGEIWFGRNTLAESIKVSQRAKNIKWELFQFMVFDAPAHDGVFEGISTISNRICDRISNTI
jgi:hypothetical protein